MQPDTHNNRDQAQNIVGDDVKHEGPESSFMPIRHALVGERRESCKCSAESRRHQQPPTIMLVVRCPGENVAYNHAADYVYQQGPIRETVMVRYFRRKA